MRSIVALCLLISIHANAQDSLSRFKSNFLAPAILISSGLIAATDNEVFDRWEIREAQQSYFSGFRTHADDYLQFAPVAAAFAMDAFKVKGVHNIGPKAVLFLKSEIIMTAMVFPLKHFIGEPRPDTGVRNSFPSGHTAQAFAAATFFHKEYGHLSVWYSIGAYTVASSVGALRILNDRHWASDVLVGAGIGILATNLAYMTERKSKHTHHVVLSKLKVSPIYSQRTYGMSILLTRL